MPQPDGPSLETYTETRFNLLIEALKAASAAQAGALGASIEMTKVMIEAHTKASSEMLAAADLRYEQRFQASEAALKAALLAVQTATTTAFNTSEKSVQAALAAAKEAVTKAESASEKRFESVNEFRATLADQQARLMPRAEVQVVLSSIGDKVTDLQKRFDAIHNERRGVQGGWGYAVGVVGFVLAIMAVVAAIAAFWSRQP